jgi:hypothetical protein
MMLDEQTETLTMKYQITGSDVRPGAEMTTFPRTTIAMAAYSPAVAASLAINEPDCASPADRADWRRRRNARRVTRAAVLNAYATELLPAILGGEWRESRAQFAVYGHGRFNEPERWQPADHHELFDHIWHFRRRHTLPGVLTWKNCAVVSAPYDAFDNDGTLNREAVSIAHRLARRFAIGVWARPDLSAWLPGFTSLVIAATGLQPERAAEFGFTALS